VRRNPPNAGADEFGFNFGFDEPIENSPGENRSSLGENRLLLATAAAAEAIPWLPRLWERRLSDFIVIEWERMRCLFVGGSYSFPNDSSPENG
jgi:hypothetical protein